MHQGRGELADFLRSRREKLTPDKAGLPEGRRRRTPGLRREEVAELAGIGVDWLTRLEQGRSRSPSITTIDALARALKLSKGDLAHLRRLARSGELPAFVRERAPEALVRIIEALEQPAYLTGRRWDVLAWNKAADDLFSFSRLAEDERNTLVGMMTDPASRKMFGAGWSEEARRMIAQFRATFDLYADDPAFVDLVGRLRRESREFAQWWRAHDVRASAAGRKLIAHPRKGEVRLAYATFQSNDDPGLKLVIYAPA